ncbi:MAG: DUF6868 family protein [Planctomycetota bacterium]|jgi:hypothetical protein
MDIERFRAFFMWCTILNVALLLLSSLFCVCAGDWVYQIHSKLFSIPREAFNVAIFSFIALYKMLFIVLNLIPYIALRIIG